MTADEAFEMCAKYLQSNADLHCAYSDPDRSRYREQSPDRDKWAWSADFLNDAARQIRKFQADAVQKTDKV